MYIVVLGVIYLIDDPPQDYGCSSMKTTENSAIVVKTGLTG